MIMVVPPAAAASVPVAQSSAVTVPPNGMSMWVWASIKPGMTSLPDGVYGLGAVRAEVRADGDYLLVLDEHVGPVTAFGRDDGPAGEKKPAHSVLLPLGSGVLANSRTPRALASIVESGRSPRADLGLVLYSEPDSGKRPESVRSLATARSEATHQGCHYTHCETLLSGMVGVPGRGADS